MIARGGAVRLWTTTLASRCDGAPHGAQPQIWESSGQRLTASTRSPDPVRGRGAIATARRSHCCPCGRLHRARRHGHGARVQHQPARSLRWPLAHAAIRAGPSAAGECNASVSVRPHTGHPIRWRLATRVARPDRDDIRMARSAVPQSRRSGCASCRTPSAPTTWMMTESPV